MLALALGGLACAAPFREAVDDEAGDDAESTGESDETGSDTSGVTNTGNCGNGVVELGEQCDGGALGGATCESVGFGGGGLSCADDCTFDTSQCSGCGNGVVDGDEQCDGSDLGDAQTCLDVGLGNADEALACNADCTYDFGMCSGCGDGVVTNPEACEPPSEALPEGDLDGQTCGSLGFDEGELACTQGCAFDTSGCATCGDAVQQPGEACDGADFGALDCSDFLSASMQPFDEGSLTCTDSCMIDLGNCSLCGDGEVSGAEICEVGVLEGETCESQGFDAGTLACTADCAGFDTSMCTNCGDGTIEGDEQCEGNDLAGETCNSLGFDGGGTLTCTNTCSFDTTDCTSNTCGNGAVNGNDECDCGNQGSNCTAAQLGNETCMTQGFDGGTLACHSPNNCTFDTSGCTDCGDGVVEGNEACDGNNLNGQTCVSQGFAGGGTLGCTPSCTFNTAMCTQVPNPYTVCANPNSVIPQLGLGTASNINVAVAGNVTDVNVSLTAAHEWPGDMRFTLSHGGTSRIVIDRPGVPSDPLGCATPDFAVTLDDEGNGGAVENTCANSAPGIASPPNRTPNNPLSGFDGASMQGMWTLTPEDLAAASGGTFQQWCLTIAWQ